MRYKTVEEILDWTAAFHERLARLTRTAARKQDRQRLGLLLDYLADHQAELKQALEEFEDEVPERLLATWFDRSPEIELPSLPEEGRRLGEAECVDDVVRRVLEFHEHMVEVYSNLREQTNNDHLREMFDSLVGLEQNEKLRLLRGARQLQDL